MYQTSLDTRGRSTAESIDADPLLQLYRWMLLSRQLDTAKADLVNRGEAFFHISGCGHEGMAALRPHLTSADWLHLHYRDQALALAMGVPPEAYLNSVLCNSQSYCQGRQMSAMLSWRPLNILSTTTSVGNSGLQAAGVALEIRDRPGRPIVVCSMGDGTSQQGEVMEALAEAARSELPMLFVVEDNGYSISTPTAGRTFYNASRGTVEPQSFLGLPIHRLDGRDVVPCYRQLGPIVESVRSTRRPAIVLLRVERLADHSNADDERLYRSEENRREARETGDPIQNLSLRLLGRGTPQTTLEAIEESVRGEILAAVEHSLAVEQPAVVLDAKAKLPPHLVSSAAEFRGDGSNTNGAAQLTMLEAMREVLRTRLAADPRVCLFGEDIEDPKGDVFGVTRGLSTAFPGRVVNSPLSEATIMGVSIGRALMGSRPVAFLQFADFLPVTLNQVMSELSTMHWRTAGEWNCPVIVMAACGGYRPGLGPFHSQTMEAIAAHMPGVDVFMPSTATDAAGLLNAAFESPRPSLVLYPKVCLNDRNTTTSADVERKLVPIGKARHVTRGDHLSIVAWGSTVQICEKAAAAIAAAGQGLGVDLIDLRSIAPWDQDAVLESATRTGKLLVVHEDNLTCGFGAEIVATVCEKASRRVVARRVTRPDTYVPCNFPNQLEVLPSFKRVMSVAAELLDLDLTWTLPPSGDDGLFVVEAMGASPADQAITIVEWAVKPGQHITAGDHLAVVEADKAVTDLSAPVTGIVARLLVAPGQSARIGLPIAEISPETKIRRQRQTTREESGTPVLRRRGKATAPREAADRGSATPIGSLVAMSAPYAARGSRLVTNAELAPRFPGKTAEDIVRGTGIHARPWLGEGQTMLAMAMQAVQAAIAGEGIKPHDIDLIICSTSTPPFATPTTACLVLNELSKLGESLEIPAYDLSAACSGYLYAMASAHDFLRAKPNGIALVLTAEAMSRVVDPADFDSAILFGDAASATILYGQENVGGSRAMVRRPVLSGKGEDGSLLSVPSAGWGGYLKMNGKKVFAEAVKQMVAILKRACAEAGIQISDLSLVVPHQANARIVEAVRQRAGISVDRMVNDIGQSGNTSSSTIPLCLADLLVKQPAGGKIGLCAFGAGLTMGAAIVELLPAQS
ncbi:MAG TPA: beta-ketoacyl-ACP synthase 3 [Pirellulales bacterium]|jgi:2-oxoisovalerate dehydrogenase E1 component|nr:beta-ketoacyl-ACP synthase 3 [Pirellulales bacterium]